MAVRAYFAIRSNSHGKMSFCEIKKTFHDFKAYKPKGTVGNTATLPTHPKRQLYISLKIMPPMIRGPMWPKGVSYMTPGLQGSYMAVQPKLDGCPKSCPLRGMANINLRTRAAQTKRAAAMLQRTTRKERNSTEFSAAIQPAFKSISNPKWQHVDPTIWYCFMHEVCKPAF